MLRAVLRNFDGGRAAVHDVLGHTLDLIAEHHGIAPSGHEFEAVETDAPLDLLGGKNLVTVSKQFVDRRKRIGTVCPTD